MARIIKPPTPISLEANEFSIFLAGSIEMGTAENWQAVVENALQDLNVVLLNPRRDEWNSSWVQSINNPQFRAQVEWELEGIERATLVATYFDPMTKAPITLLELGLCARSGKAIVCCPDGYWRRGNIEVVCHRYGVPLVTTLDELIALMNERAVK